MKVLKTLAALLVGLVVTVASLPWVLWSIGRMVCGDEEGADRAMEASPLWRLFDYVESRRAD